MRPNYGVKRIATTFYPPKRNFVNEICRKRKLAKASRNIYHLLLLDGLLKSMAYPNKKHQRNDFFRMIFPHWSRIRTSCSLILIEKLS